MKLHFWRRLAVIETENHENDHPKSLHELIDRATLDGVTKSSADIDTEDVLQLINFTTKNRRDWRFFSHFFWSLSVTKLICRSEEIA